MIFRIYSPRIRPRLTVAPYYKRVEGASSFSWLSRLGASSECWSGRDRSAAYPVQSAKLLGCHVLGPAEAADEVAALGEAGLECDLLDCQGSGDEQPLRIQQPRLQQHLHRLLTHQLMEFPAEVRVAVSGLGCHVGECKRLSVVSSDEVGRDPHLFQCVVT